MSPIKEYDAKIDLKRRVTIRGARYDHYHVTEFDDGRIELAPRVLVEPFELSARTLTVKDATMEKRGKPEKRRRRKNEKIKKT
jgi:hypothetical protein